MTLSQTLEQATSKPLNKWTLEEMLAYNIFQSDAEILRLQKQLKQAKEHNYRLKQQWHRLSTKKG